MGARAGYVNGIYVVVTIDECIPLAEQSRMGEVMRNFGRSVIIDLGWSITGEISDDHWEVIQLQNISAWSEALTVLGEGKTFW
jgi:hypothetical protein